MHPRHGGPGAAAHPYQGVLEVHEPPVVHGEPALAEAFRLLGVEGATGRPEAGPAPTACPPSLRAGPPARPLPFCTCSRGLMWAVGPPGSWDPSPPCLPPSPTWQGPGGAQGHVGGWGQGRRQGSELAGAGPRAPSQWSPRSRKALGVGGGGGRKSHWLALLTRPRPRPPTPGYDLRVRPGHLGFQVRPTLGPVFSM